MISFVKSLFGSNKNEANDAIDTEKLEAVKGAMTSHLNDTATPRLKFPDGFDPDKKTVIILDDSFGATMLFDDTIEKLMERKDGLTDGIQFIKISTPLAVFMLQEELNHETIRNIVGGVLDITIGGWAVKDGETSILDGIDAYMMIKEKFPDSTLRFFTSHSMNAKNAEIYKFMQKFNKLTGLDIQDYTYMKNPFSTNRYDMMVTILKEIKERG
jgi:hypothetical protein